MIAPAALDHAREADADRLNAFHTQTKNKKNSGNGKAGTERRKNENTAYWLFSTKKLADARTPHSNTSNTPIAAIFSSRVISLNSQKTASEDKKANSGAKRIKTVAVESPKSLATKANA